MLRITSNAVGSFWLDEFRLQQTTVPDLIPPTVSITAPGSGAVVSNIVTVSASASDDVSVAGVQFTLDGVNLGPEVTAAPYAVMWQTATAVPGSHLLTAVARDASGNRTTAAAVPVTVWSTPE